MGHQDQFYVHVESRSSCPETMELSSPAVGMMAPLRQYTAEQQHSKIVSTPHMAGWVHTSEHGSLQSCNKHTCSSFSVLIALASIWKPQGAGGVPPAMLTPVHNLVSPQPVTSRCKETVIQLNSHQHMVATRVHVQDTKISHLESDYAAWFMAEAVLFALA